MAKAKKTKVSMLDAAIMGAATPTMGKLKTSSKKAVKANKTKKVTLLDAAITGATTPPMGKSEKGKNAAEKTGKAKKK